ncbi:hypothetical protein, partial [Nocardia tenerifensis]
ILHLLEQDPLAPGTAAPTLDAELVELVQTDSASTPGPLVHPEFRAFRSGPPDPTRTRTILHDRHITDTAPVGLDVDDPAEMIRLALLPERPIGFRRTEDFHEAAMRRTMLAVYRHFAIDQPIRLTYHGYADPATGWFALPTALA